MVQVLDGQAAMLGYSFPRGADVLVCSSSKPAELITIEARHTLRGGRSDYGTELEDTTMTQGSEEITSVPQALGCQLRFASHTLGQQILASGAGSGRSLSFGLVIHDSHPVALDWLDNIYHTCGVTMLIRQSLCWNLCLMGVISL